MSSSGSDMAEDTHLAMSSFHLPIDAGDGPTPPGSLLLDYTAYFDDRRNATTACSKTKDGHSIRVTFWPAHPPRLSYFSVHCPDLDPCAFAVEPFVVAAHHDLVLLYVALGPQQEMGSIHRVEYFVYQAGGGGHWAAPSLLQPIKSPGPTRYFNAFNLGLMRCRRPIGKRSRSKQQLSLAPHTSQDDGFYVAAALCHRSGLPSGQYDLHAYDSRTKEWTTRAGEVPEERERNEFVAHCCGKVITVGGDAGTMGWVDLNHSILFCDVLPALRRDVDHPPFELRRVALPADTSQPRERDIAVAQGRISYVEFERPIRPGLVDWTATIWTSTNVHRPRFSSRSRHQARASQITVPENKQAQFELLPALVDDHGAPQPALERLHTGLPALSLHEDGVLYLTAKIDYHDTDKAWVLAIDVKNKVLRGVAEFDARRMLGMNGTYICTTISEHLPYGFTLNQLN